MRPFNKRLSGWLDLVDKVGEEERQKGHSGKSDAQTQHPGSGGENKQTSSNDDVLVHLRTSVNLPSPTDVLRYIAIADRSRTASG